MALAHELTSLSRGLNRGYLVAQARLHLEKKEIQNAKSCLQKAITFNFQVIVICKYRFAGGINTLFNRTLLHGLCWVTVAIWKVIWIVLKMRMNAPSAM